VPSQHSCDIWWRPLEWLCLIKIQDGRCCHKGFVVTSFPTRIPLLANLSYPERLAALYLEPLELLTSGLVLYYKCLHDLVALPSSEYFKGHLTNGSPHKREQVIIDCSVLCALPNFMKTTFVIAVYLVGIVYHIQWLMLAPFHVSNAFYI